MPRRLQTDGQTGVRACRQAGQPTDTGMKRHRGQDQTHTEVLIAVPFGCGCSGMYYSFTSAPHLDVAVRPLGLPLPSVMPGVDTALRGVLSKLISRRMVEPQRRYLDIHRIYLNKHIARVRWGQRRVAGSGVECWWGRSCWGQCVAASMAGDGRSV